LEDLYEASFFTATAPLKIAQITSWPGLDVNPNFRRWGMRWLTVPITAGVRDLSQAARARRREFNSRRMASRILIRRGHPVESASRTTQGSGAGIWVMPRSAAWPNN